MKVMKKLALAAMAIAAIAPGAQQVKAEQGTTQSVRQKEAVKQPVISSRQYVRQNAGGFNVIGHDAGIPPHIYGTYHVRRGTHKRTNKK